MNHLVLALQAASAFGRPDRVAIGFFAGFITLTLGITYWAARRTSTTEHFYAAGRSVTAGQNGFALAGDYMSAASFLGIAGLVSTSGFDGLIYSTGWLVGWPVVLFLIAEPLRNLGRYTFADVVAAWTLTYVYVQWANRVYDPALAALRAHHADDDAAARSER